MRAYSDKIRTFLLCLPYGFRGLNTRLLSQFILREDDPVSLARITGNRHGNIAQIRLGDHLDRGKIAVLINVKNNPVHNSNYR